MIRRIGAVIALLTIASATAFGQAQTPAHIQAEINQMQKHAVGSSWTGPHAIKDGQLQDKQIANLKAKIKDLRAELDILEILIKTTPSSTNHKPGDTWTAPDGVNTATMNADGSVYETAVGVTDRPLIINAPDPKASQIPLRADMMLIDPKDIIHGENIAAPIASEILRIDADGHANKEDIARIEKTFAGYTQPNGEFGGGASARPDGVYVHPFTDSVLVQAVLTLKKDLAVEAELLRFLEGRWPVK